MWYLQAYKAWVQTYGEEKRLPAVNLTNDQLFFVGFAQVCVLRAVTHGDVSAAGERVEEESVQNGGTLGDHLQYYTVLCAQ